MEELGGEPAPRADRGWGRIVARLRRRLPVLRVAASVAMLALLLHEVKLRSLFPVWDRATFGWLAAGVGCTMLGILVSAVRWQRVLSAMDLPAKLGPTLHAYLAGQFVSNFLPSTIGGDAVRISRVSSREGSGGGGPRVTDAFASVVLDRMSGWLILPLLCLAGLVINPTLLHLGRSSRAAVAVSLVTLTALVAVVAAAASPRIGGRLAGRSNWMRFMGAVHLGLDGFRRRPAAAAQVIAISVVYQLVIVGAGLLAAEALGIHIGPTAMLAFIPVVAIVQILPVSVGGLGVREGAFVLFLQPLGVAVGQAIALGLVMYAMHLLSSLLGAPSFAVGKRGDKRGGKRSGGSLGAESILVASGGARPPTVGLPGPVAPAV